MGDVSADELEEFRKLEEAMWRSETRFDHATMDALLSDDFLEFGCSGAVYDKAATLAVAPQAICLVLPLPDFTARRIGATVVQSTYRSIQMMPDGNRKCALRSSIWKQTEHGWRLTFHQGTLI